MNKVYKDFDEVVKPTRVPKKLWKYEDEMKQKPNFDKCNKGERGCCKNEKNKKSIKAYKKY